MHSSQQQWKGLPEDGTELVPKHAGVCVSKSLQVTNISSGYRVGKQSDACKWLLHWLRVIPHRVIQNIGQYFGRR